MNTDLAHYKSLQEIPSNSGLIRSGHNNISTRDRFPTLHEVLYRQTSTPVDLWSFYCYMRDNQKAIDYLDFWLDSSQHLILCQRYVAGLKENLVRDSRIRHAQEIEQQRLINNSNISNKRETTATTATNTSNQHRSMSSSVLLDMIMHDNILDETDSHRLSAFLRGERGVVVDNPEVAEYIEALNRQSMSSEQLLNELNRNSGMNQQMMAMNTENEKTKRISTINPTLVENFIQVERQNANGSIHSFITRDDIKKNAREIFLTYFNKNSIKSLMIPEYLHRQLLTNFENGRDDPDIFNDTRAFVFKIMENEAFPGFLTKFGIMNIPTQIWRFFLSLFILFIGFWISYCFIFLNFNTARRCYVIIPFFIASYLLISYIYCIDPILAICSYSYNVYSTKYGFVPIREPFVRKILLQRSLWVLLAIALLTACLSVLFIFVPGRRL